MNGNHEDIACAEMLADVVYSLASCAKADVVFLGDELLCVVAHYFEPLDYLCGYLTAVFPFKQPPVWGAFACGIFSVSVVNQDDRIIYSFL